MAKVRDFMSGLTHCIAAGLSLVGLVILIIFSAFYGDVYDIVSFTIFGVSLFLMYLFSTLYHWLNISEKKIKSFKKFDHIMIYILIAATYTPICLGPLRGPWGWSLFGIIWGFATIGTVFSAIWTKVPKVLNIIIYVMMAIIFLITLYPLICVYQKANLLYSLLWLLIAIILYGIGYFLYTLKIPKNINIKNLGHHEILHIFIILGSICQYWFILKYITIL